MKKKKKNKEKEAVKKEDIKEKKEENSTEDKENNLKKEFQNQNKLLKNLLMGIGIFIVFLIFLFVMIHFENQFEYNGAVFKKIKEGQLIFYNIQIPVLDNGKIVPYNFYLRNNPEKLEKDVPFNGELSLLKNAVINMSEDLDCDGDAIIGVVNLLRLYESLGIDVIRDETASCDKLGRYMYLNIQESNETSVEQFGPACYNLNFNNCEILKTTERFMIETFAEDKKIRNYSY